MTILDLTVAGAVRPSLTAVSIESVPVAAVPTRPVDPGADARRATLVAERPAAGGAHAGGDAAGAETVR